MSAPLGNQNAKKENRLVTDTLRRVVTQNPEKIRKACENILNDAKEGNLQAFKEISDRLDGKPAQAIDATIANPDGTNLESSTDIEIARKLAFVLDNALRAKESE